MSPYLLPAATDQPDGSNYRQVGRRSPARGPPEGPIVADFKTSARSGEPLEIFHEIQLSAYSYPFRHRWGRREGGLEIRSLVKTKVPKIDFHRYPARGENHLRRLFALIREYLDALDRRQFVFRSGLACSYCDYRDGPCRRWHGRE